MERQKRLYSIYSRPTISSNRVIYYVRFRPGSGRYRTAVSTGCSRRDDAVRWCEKRLKLKTTEKTGTVLRDYVEGFWDIGSRHVEGRRARGYELSVVLDDHVFSSDGGSPVTPRQMRRGSRSSRITRFAER